MPRLSKAKRSARNAAQVRWTGKSVDEDEVVMIETVSSNVPIPAPIQVAQDSVNLDEPSDGENWLYQLKCTPENLSKMLKTLKHHRNGNSQSTQKRRKRNARLDAEAAVGARDLSTFGFIPKENCENDVSLEGEIPTVGSTLCPVSPEEFELDGRTNL
jgi:hypothetical protein